MKFVLYFLLAITTPALADQEADLTAAYQAFRAGDENRLERAAARLHNTPLDVYGHYYQLRLNLDKANNTEVQKFLTRKDDSVLQDKLRGEWLKVLGKRQQWADFDAEFPHLVNEDIEITCYALQSRWQNRDVSALQAARKLWFTGKGLADSCGTIFDAATTAGVITEEDIWQRFRLALEAGNTSLAQRLSERLTGSHTVSAPALKSAASDPHRYLKSLISTPHSVWTDGRRALALFTLTRVAKQSPDIAYGFWQDLNKHFTETEQQYFYGWLAYEAARRHDDRALAWFKLSSTNQLNELQRAWRVRAALRVQDWITVLNSINAMDDTQQREAAWRYWKARALQATGKTIEANKILAPLSTEINFYGLLANDELSNEPALKNTSNTFKPQRSDLNAMRERPGIQRTIVLYRADMRSEALKEWAWTLRNFTDQELLTAAEVARRNDMFDRAIGAADKTVSVHDFSLRYLSPYRSALRPYIQEHGLEEAWVYGLMRQESRFATSAKSNVGAAGLMQVMPATAHWLANKLGLKGFKESMLHHLDTNLRLGTFYMKTVFDQLQNSPVMASAGYNAGPGRAKRWRAEQALEGAIYTESIPYEETRDYVKKVMSNTVFYAEQFNAPVRPLKQRLGIIPAKGSAP